MLQDIYNDTNSLFVPNYGVINKTFNKEKNPTFQS